MDYTNPFPRYYFNICLWSNIFCKNANSEIDIINSDEVYKFLLTPKNLRKKINKMNLNFSYLFDDKVINITDIKVDGILNESLNDNFNQIRLFYLWVKKREYIF